MKKGVYGLKKYIMRLEFFLLVMFSTFVFTYSPNKYFSIFIGFVILIISWLIGGKYSNILYSSKHCSLTGVYNRSILDFEVPCLFDKLNEKNIPLSICFMDIDDFKEINDVKGHLYGDGLLVILTKHFEKYKRKIDYFVRYGGDEFLLICPYTDKEEMKNIMERILKDLNREISLSYGIATFPEDGNSIYELLDICDKKMYQMKRQKKNGIIFTSTT